MTADDSFRLSFRARRSGETVSEVVCLVFGLLRLWVEERDGEYLYPLCVCLLLGLRFRLELGLASLLYTCTNTKSFKLLNRFAFSVLDSKKHSHLTHLILVGSLNRHKVREHLEVNKSILQCAQKLYD